MGTGIWKIHFVIMNDDGSKGIDVDVKSGVEVPFFGSIGDILLGAELLLV